MAELTMSPLPKTAKIILNGSPKTMRFSEAMEQILLGKKISKLEWGDREYYGFMNGEILSLHKPNGKNYQWIINLGDISGNDYIVI